MTTTGSRPVADPLRVALAPRVRPRPAGPVTASLTFGWRALLKIKHVPDQLFDVTAFPIMATLMFTYLFGGALAGSPQEYLRFALPGIMVMAVAMITVYTGVAVNTDVSTGIFDRFRTLAVWRPAVLVGALLGDVLRYTFASAVVLGLGTVLGFRAGGGVWGVLAAIVALQVFAFSMSWIWIMLGLLLRSPTAVTQVNMAVMFPLVFGSNVFVAPITMPGWLQAFIDVNPISYAVTALRGLVHGTATTGDLAALALVCALLIGVFAPLTAYVYRRGGHAH